MSINLKTGALKPSGKQVIEDQAKKITNATNTQRVYLITMMKVSTFCFGGMAGA
ncbi:MAG: hypothetical protein JNM68_16595, partial [Dinghuibacter sp.]|nr:hypothetical protein [Dinghuibacter sp.]